MREKLDCLVANTNLLQVTRNSISDIIRRFVFCFCFSSQIFILSGIFSQSSLINILTNLRFVQTLCNEKFLNIDPPPYVTLFTIL